jgi:hypothetical protein
MNHHEPQEPLREPHPTPVLVVQLYKEAACDAVGAEKEDGAAGALGRGPCVADERPEANDLKKNQAIPFVREAGGRPGSAPTLG